jgi:[glutamine synthetase] adenylyltransferase / [glutamine synthetase]-adenylyl-L-tyrosine phosphorylase
MAARDIRDLLLAPRMDPSRVAELLGPYGLADIKKADANLQSAAANPGDRLLLADILGELLACVSDSANPDQALTYFERFASAASSRAHLFTYLGNSKQVLEILARSLGGSAYMAEILIRDPHHFYWVTDPQILHGTREKTEMQRELDHTLKMLEHEGKQLEYLRAFKRKEMLLIGVRDLLRICSVEETLTALSLLAEVLISAVYGVCETALRRVHKIPPKLFLNFTILAMGKLGGGELNFSSDVDLMFLYARNDEHAPGISAPDYFRRLVQKITSGLSSFTGEGYVYRVDLRLRPEGDAGNLADPLAGYERYYRTRMGAWERLALLKAWPIAGDLSLGRKFLEMSRPFIYFPDFDVHALAEVREMKARLDEKISARGQTERNVKLGTGGIREIELVVQSIQAAAGARNRGILERNTLRSLDALREKALINVEDFDMLHNAYLFLRDVENKLQMVDDAQTHSLPREPEGIHACARLLGYTSANSMSAADSFLRDLRHHTGRVNRIFTKAFGLRA